MASVDVTVLGAGIFGLSIAWACARRGAVVRVVDPFGIGSGSSGGLVGALSPHVPDAWNAKKAFQLDSLLMAADWWAEVEAGCGLASGYGRVGRLQPLDDDAAVELARSRAVTAEKLWRGQATWRVVPVRTGWGPPSRSGWWVEDSLSARVSPRLGLQALAAALRLRGAELAREGVPSGAVVHATGVAGLQSLSSSLQRPLGGGVKGQALSLQLDLRDEPQLFVDGLHIVPHVDGTVAVGSTSETTWTVDGVDERLDALLERAVEAVPALAGAPVVARWAGVRPRAVTRGPVLGRWPGRTGEYVANGGFKIGFGMAPKVAEVMADLVLDNRDAIPDAFRIEHL